MPLRYPYADAYLAPLVTQAREDQANDDVALLGTFPAGWVQRLVVLRSYVITCQESMRQEGDLFTQKLAAYRKDYADALVQAKAAQEAIDAASATPPTGGGSFFTVDLQRG